MMNTNTTKAPRCAAISQRSGHQCSWLAVHEGLCVAHAAGHGVPAAVEEQRRRGARGRVLATQHRAERASQRVSLATPADLRRLLERAAQLALSASGDHLARARALAAIAGQAADLLARGLERDTQRFAALMRQHPTVAAQVEAE